MMMLPITTFNTSFATMVVQFFHSGISAATNSGVAKNEPRKGATEKLSRSVVESNGHTLQELSASMHIMLHGCQKVKHQRQKQCKTATKNCRSGGLCMVCH